MSEDYSIRVVEYARTVDQPVSVALYGAHNGGIDPMPYGFVLIKNKDRVVLVDVGFEARGSGEEMRKKFHVDPYLSPVDALSGAGVSVDEVSDVIITHAHYDHMGSLGSFPNAKFYLQREELAQWKWAMGLGPRFANLTAACNPDDIVMAEKLIEQGRMTLLEGPVRELFPGISIELAPNGHSYMQQFAIIDTRSFGRYIAAGDAVYSRRNFTGFNEDGAFIALGAGVGSQTEMIVTLEKIERLAEGDLQRILIVHDNATYESSGSRTVNGMRIAEICTI